MDFRQPRAGFRPNCGTNYLLSVKLLIEKYVEYNKPLNQVSVDLYKVFDFVELDGVVEALNESRFDR